MRIRIIIFLMFFYNCSSTKEYRKYNVEKGIITYSLKHPLKSKPIEQRVYFTNYGSTEYIEFVNKEDFPNLPILKKDSLEYVFVTDTMTIKNTRGFDYIYEKLIKRNNSELSNKELSLAFKSDTLIQNKNCELFNFIINDTKQSGKVALWKGVPIWVNSELEKGIYENVELIELDLTSKIPIEKTKIMDYIDTE